MSVNHLSDDSLGELSTLEAQQKKRRLNTRKYYAKERPEEEPEYSFCIILISTNVLSVITKKQNTFFVLS